MLRLFKLLVILHTLGATVWVGGHLVLAVTVLPQALKNHDPDRIHQFEEPFEGFGLASLLLQVITVAHLDLLSGLPKFPGI
ncbi:hypothetical protein [Trichothermofontia sp.]